MAYLENSEELVARIQSAAPPGSVPVGAAARNQLQELTRKLTASYLSQGRLRSDPFADARTRTIYCCEPEIREALLGNTVLVTGGSGCVGRTLIAALQDFKPRRIVCVDWAASAPAGAIHYRVDVRERHALRNVFERERPGIVFHLAAQRNPGLAEHRIHETVTTNVFGTSNVIAACEESGVDVCVYSSTGKASRYLTDEVYAASKKLSEWQMAVANRSGGTKYTLVRFTHILENSLVCGEMNAAIEASQPVGVHAPGRFVVAQNAHEAVQLLLNGAIGAAKGPIRLSVVRNLGWPVETLELALYLIRESGRDLPVYFLGCPRGYWEDFFRGQVDWRDPVNVHPLLNVLESPARRVDASGTVIWTELEEIDEDTFESCMAALHEIVSSDGVGDEHVRNALTAVSAAMCRSALDAAPAAELLNILNWGVAPRYVEWGSSGVLFEPMVGMLCESLRGRVGEAAIRSARLTVREYARLVELLEQHGFSLTERSAEVGLVPAGASF